MAARAAAAGDGGAGVGRAHRRDGRDPIAGSVASLGNVSAGGGIRIDRPDSTGVKSCRLDYGVRLLTQGFDAPQTFSLTLGF